MMMLHYVTQFVGASAARVAVKQVLHLAPGFKLLVSGGGKPLSIVYAWLGHGYSSVSGFT